MTGRICETDIEKYQILEERDKLMHRGRLKTTDVENATAMQVNYLYLYFLYRSLKLCFLAP